LTQTQGNLILNFEELLAHDLVKAQVILQAFDHFKVLIILTLPLLFKKAYLAQQKEAEVTLVIKVVLKNLLGFAHLSDLLAQ